MFVVIDLKPGESAPKGKNQVPSHRQYGFSAVQLDPLSGRVIHYMHETGGWAEIDSGDPVWPMSYSTVSGANRAIKIANPPVGILGESRFAIWIADRCPEPDSKVRIFCRHLQCEVAARRDNRGE